MLRLWEGLGYYRRARQLHEAARLIVVRDGGRFPRDVAELCRLPGVGRYTAGAIVSIAFDLPAPILEANTIRLFSRLLAYRGQVDSARGVRLGWAMAEAVLPRRSPGRFNSALMELGSEVCRPRAPRCDACPVAPLCRAFLSRVQTRIPSLKQKPASTAVREAAVVVRRRGRVLLLRRPDGGRWAGLWDFPRFPLDGGNNSAAAVHRALIDGVRALTGATVRPGRFLATFKHGVTRFRITLDCYEAEYISRDGPPGDRDSLRWLRPGELDVYPLCTTGRKLARQIEADCVRAVPSPSGRGLG